MALEQKRGPRTVKGINCCISGVTAGQPDEFILQLPYLCTRRAKIIRAKGRRPGRINPALTGA
jgi:hypothetical protein